MKARGFTLIEVMVMIAIFAVVVIISISALITIMRGSDKVQNEATTVNNLQSGIEQMIRVIRDGSNFHCGSTDGGSTPFTQPRACAAGGEIMFAVEPQGGDPASGADQVVYCLGYPATNNCNVAGTHLLRSTTGGGAGSFEPVTSDPSVIDLLSFRGTSAGTQRGQVLIVIAGSTGVPTRTESVFSFQTTVAERLKQVPTNSSSHTINIQEN